MASQFRCTRSILIDAPAASILPEIADLERHVLWSPFSRPDPKSRDFYSGAPGAGQSRAFEGGQNGAGIIRIESVEPHHVLMRLDMRKPMKASNLIEFTLLPEGDGTRVSWSLTGQATLIWRLVSLFMDCEAMCGRQLEEGLATLKAEMEGRRAAA
ncbi:MAG: hypothetical protein JWM36_4631 [Hyphomicrobiales bacterium]|nr:hypothetical protein [Hyphomicrobiales bacterium]